MTRRRLVPRALRLQVRQQPGGLLRHPGPGIRTRDAVRDVLVGDLRGKGRTVHRRQRTRAAAVLASLCAVFLPLAAALATPAAAADGEEPTTFTVALLNEVDSFNPFLGIEAESYEMWALAYDYLVGYSMDGHVARAGAGHGVGDLRRRPDLDLHHARRRDLVRR